MTAIISRPNEKPKLKITWWAMVLGVLSLLCVCLNDFTAEKIADWLSYIAPIFGVAALGIGILSYIKGERSWVLWVGIIPALFITVLGILVLLITATAGL